MVTKKTSKTSSKSKLSKTSSKSKLSKTSSKSKLSKTSSKSKPEISTKNKFGIKIENIVASAAFNVVVDLNKICKKNDGMEYEPEQFPGLVHRMTNPKAAALIFGSGKVVCTGARSLKDVKEVFRKVALIIRKIGTKVSNDYKFQTENIVSSAKLERNLNLDVIAFNLENAEYEPEQFPGLVHRMTNPKVAFLLFGSGKIVITGARSVKDVYIAVEKINRKLKTIKAFVNKKE